MGGRGGGGAEGGPETATVLPVTGESVDELFFYEVPEVTLKRGARAGIAILEEMLDYSDVYSWKLVDTDEYAWRRWSHSYAAGQGRSAPDREALARGEEKPKVWHAMRLGNTTKSPWTTAPALVVRGWQPVSQSMVLYTPVGGRVDVTTTVAPDILTDNRELENDRQRDALTANGTHYDLVTVHGEVTISNHKPREVRLTATRELGGVVTETTEGGTSEKLAVGGLNPVTRISWDLKIPPGAEKRLSYVYTVYVVM
jgi:hypothetical protein